MVLSNCWWLIIWILTGGLFINAIFPLKETVACGKKEYRHGMLSSFLIFLPYIVWAGCRNDMIGDTWAYRHQFLQTPGMLDQAISFINESSKDKGFSALMVAIKYIAGNSDTVFFLLIALFQGICLVWVYKKYSSDYWLSIFLFIASTDYLSWMHNGMRQFIAVAGVFACTKLILQKRYVAVTIMVLLLSTIHASALIMLPIILIVQGEAWNKGMLMFLCIVMIAVFFTDQFTSVLDGLIANTQYEGMISGEIWANDNGTSLFRVAVYSMPAILSFFCRDYINHVGNPIINLSCNMSIVSAAIYALSSVTSGIYVGRLPIYCSLYGYILLPWIFKNVFEKKTRQMIYAVTVCAYIVFFYFQLHYAWGLI